MERLSALYTSRLNEINAQAAAVKAEYDTGLEEIKKNPFLLSREAQAQSNALYWDYISRVEELSYEYEKVQNEYRNKLQQLQTAASLLRF